MPFRHEYKHPGIFLDILHMKEFFFSYQNIIVSGFLCAGVFMLMQKNTGANIGAPCRQLIGGFLLCLGLGVMMIAPQQSVMWQEYDEKAFESAEKDGRFIILNFHADWCYPCYQLNRFTFSDSKVIDYLDSWTRLEIDMTHQSDIAVQKIAGQFKVMSLPTIMLRYGAFNNRQELRVLGFKRAQDIIALLDKARGQ